MNDHDRARATWDHFREASRSSPILERFAEYADRRDCSREEAAIAAALWLAEDNRRLLLELQHAHDKIARQAGGSL